MKVTNGDRPLDVVPIAVRHPLLQTWVKAKQMRAEQLGRTLGTDDEVSQSKRVHRPHLLHDYLLRLFFTKTPAVTFIIQVSCNWLIFQNDTDGQKPMTRAMVAVEMHWLNHNGLMEFRDAPQLQVVSHVQS